MNFLDTIASYLKYIIAGMVFGGMVFVVRYIVNLFKKKKAIKKAGGGQMAEAPGGDDLSLLIHEAESKLAGAKLPGGTKVGNLPVFLLMGDSGTTKTTTMVQCGLDPELLAGQVYMNTDIVPTRSANIWFARGAVFVEAAGNLSADTTRWNQLVKKLQPKTSIVGKGEQAPRAAVVCFDCENFTQPGAGDAAVQSARRLRARLGEISQSLGINLPVYVLFTKVDRLPFFTEYVRNLSNEESTQVFGVTVPMVKEISAGVYAEQETNRLTWDFELLFKALADGRTEFLPRESDPAQMPGAYEFPREFRKVRPILVQFLVDLCRPAQLTVGPFLRGFYFTGVRPIVINEGSPLGGQPRRAAEVAYEAPAGATGIFRMAAKPQSQPQAPAVSQVTGSRKVPQWMFLTRLFSEVLLADRTAMGAAGASTKTSSGRRTLFIAAASLCLILTIFWTIAWSNNRGLVTQVRDAAQGISAAPLKPTEMAPEDELKKLDNLRLATQKLSKYHRDGRPFLYGWFLYTGDALYPEARRLYCGRFKQLLLGQMQNAIVQSEKALPLKQQPGSPEYSPTYDALKGYLITTSFHQYSDKAWLPPVMMEWWKNGRTASPEQTKLAQAQFDFYADERKEDDFCPVTADPVALKQARGYLLSFAGMDHVYAVMLAEANKNPGINYNRQFPEYVKVVTDPYEVRGAFSKAGWKYMKDNIPTAEKHFTGDEWVLGAKSAGTSDPAGLHEEIRRRYTGDFVKEWKTYINSGRVQPYMAQPTKIDDAVNKLGQLSSAQSALLALVCLGSENTAVDDPSVAAIFSPFQTVTPVPCSSQYLKAQNQSYMGTLGQLQLALQNVPDKKNPDSAAAGAVTAKAQDARFAVKGLTQQYRADSDPGVSAQVEKLLYDPIIQAEGAVKFDPRQLNAGGADTCKAMAPVLSKFPFNTASKVDATIPEFNAAFNPKDGVFWKFWEKDLQQFVSKQGDPAPGSKVEMTPAFLTFLRKMAAFRAAIYPGDAANPQLKYELRAVVEPQFYEKVTVNVDGQSVEFNPTSKPQAFTWPGAAPIFQVTLKAKTDQGTIPYGAIPGIWGTWHYAAESKIVGGIYELEQLDAAGRPVPLIGTNQTVKSHIELNPRELFDRTFLSGLRCVAEVVKAQ